LRSPVEADQVERLIADPARWMSEKFDVRRQLSRKRGDTITGINRFGFAVALPQPLVDDAAQCPVVFIIDGDAIGESLHAFDVLLPEDEEIGDLLDGERSLRLMNLLASFHHLTISLVITAFTAARRAARFHQLDDRPHRYGRTKLPPLSGLSLQRSCRLQDMDHPVRDEVTGFGGVGGHVRRLKVRLKGLDTRPFLDHDKGIEPALCLFPQGWPEVEGGLILDAPVLREHLRHVRTERGENGVTLAGLGGDDGDDVDHARIVASSKQKLQRFVPGRHTEFIGAVSSIGWRVKISNVTPGADGKKEAHSLLSALGRSYGMKRKVMMGLGDSQACTL